ncbi:hypothetical protein EVAR_86263_1 [Eumeta japonica]|uniref:Uncharacterized protein n=1 Tax=Eumeta variegata TaxID=151549 RepID=A0A4C1UD65_EUMVA|nr:hypothetical protein EVAR_86263_1 [Eumeta japonica]
MPRHLRTIKEKVLHNKAVSQNNGAQLCMGHKFKLSRSYLMCVCIGTPVSSQRQEANEQASHERIDGHRCPWTLTISEESPQRRVSALSASWEGIGYLMVRDWVDAKGLREWAIVTLSLWTRCNSGGSIQAMTKSSNDLPYPGVHDKSSIPDTAIAFVIRHLPSVSSKSELVVVAEPELKAEREQNRERDQNQNRKRDRD